MEPNTLAIILTIIAAGTVYFMRRQIKRERILLAIIIGVWGLCVGIQRFAVPYILIMSSNVIKASVFITPWERL